LRKVAILVTVLFFFSFCSSQPEQVERLIEDGVEVVVNHTQPYKVKGEPSTFNLDELFTIDSESEDLTRLGLTDIWGFDVDSEGSIFVFKPPMSQGELVYKFTSDGAFVRSFARRGEGPGEVPIATFQKINSRDEIWITGSSNSKIMVFDKDGNIIDEIQVGVWIGVFGNMLQLLENGNYLIRRSVPDPSTEGLNLELSLYDSEFDKMKELDRIELDHPIRADKIRIPLHAFVWSISKENVFVGNEDWGYEIHVYDLDGDRLRKIRKTYRPVKISREYKQKINKKLEIAPPALKKKIDFPEHFPPFQCLFTDDKGLLYVMTYVKGDNPKDYIFDIFNRDGIFISTMSLQAHIDDPIFTPGGPFDSWITMKKDRLYALREKNSGFKELVVYKVQRE